MKVTVQFSPLPLPASHSSTSENQDAYLKAQFLWPQKITGEDPFGWGKELQQQQKEREELCNCTAHFSIHKKA